MQRIDPLGTMNILRSFGFLAIPSNRFRDIAMKTFQPHSHTRDKHSRDHQSQWESRLPNEKKIKNHIYIKAVEPVAFQCFSLDQSGGRTKHQTSIGSLEPLKWLNLPTVHQIN